MQAKLVPYPQASAAPDTSICYGDEIRLRGAGGAFYSWSPGPSLDDSVSHDPLAHPLASTRYTLTVRDTLGCPKPDSQSVFVNVVPPIVPFAGNDTIITIGQTFQLHASGANTYAWTPPFGLSDPSIADPIVQWNQDITYQVRVTHEPEGCYAVDTIHVRYIKGPAIYVPTAFSPNGDGQNDVFRPIPVGITQIRYLEVFNRWGQRVYQTTQYMQGWDGFFNGKPAPVGAYVWMVSGEDYTGKTIVEKGTVTLIR
jgi:gliding motility-associated-like protein